MEKFNIKGGLRLWENSFLPPIGNNRRIYGNKRFRPKTNN